MDDKKATKALLSFLSICLISTAGMNICAAYQQIALAFPNQSAASVQSLSSYPSIFTVIASFLAQSVAGKFTVRRTMLFATALFVVSGLLPMFLPGFGIIILSRILIGTGIGLALPLSITIPFKVYPEGKKRNTALGLQSCAQAAGNIVATTVAGALAVINYRLCFLVHLIGLVSFLSVLFLMPDNLDNGKSEEKVAVQKEGEGKTCSFSPSILIWCLIMCSFTGFLNAFPTKVSMLVETSGIGNSTVSAAALSLFTCGTFIGGLVFGQLSRFLKNHTLTLGVAFASVSMVFMTIGNSKISVYLAGLILGFGMSIATPIILTQFVGCVDERNKTFAIALNSSMSHLGLSLSPYLTLFFARMVFSEVTFRKEFIVSLVALAILAFVCIAVLSIGNKRRKDA